LVGPYTWSPVADEMRRRAVRAVVPVLQSFELGPLPYWRQHAQAVVKAIQPVPPGEPLVLVGHSGAGVLLPAIRQLSAREVAAYIFVDAGIPQDGKSRLDLFETDEAVFQFRQAASAGWLPVWSDDDLRGVIPDAGRRQRFVADLRPLPLAVYEEVIPVFDGWPDAPAGYVRFGSNPAYDAPAGQARRAGWPVVPMNGEHFHMLVEPQAVASALIALEGRLAIR
jgi:thioesterase domain-containing protein